LGNFDPIATYISRQEDYRRFREKLVGLLVDLLELDDSDTVLIESRLKKLPSLQRKLQEYYEDVNALDEVEDLVGIRVVFLYPAQVEMAVKKLESEFTVHNKKAHDHTARGVDTFGYQSHHLVVSLDNERGKLREWRRYKAFRAEVQLRTILQHAWAAHSHGLDYKPSSVGLEDQLRRRLFMSAAILEEADNTLSGLRGDSDKIDRQYQDCIAHGRLSEVELTARSLRAFVGTIAGDLEDLRSFAERIGFDPSVQGRLGSMEEFVEYARLGGATTLAKIPSLIRAPKKHRNKLVALHARSVELGFHPAALPLDVAVFSLTFVNERARKTLIKSTYYSPKLRRAIREML
jgi:putative GTP pyrophosphokinase